MSKISRCGNKVGSTIWVSTALIWHQIFTLQMVKATFLDFCCWETQSWKILIVFWTERKYQWVGHGSKPRYSLIMLLFLEGKQPPSPIYCWLFLVFYWISIYSIIITSSKLNFYLFEFPLNFNNTQNYNWTYQLVCKFCFSCMVEHQKLILNS